MVRNAAIFVALLCGLCAGAQGLARSKFVDRHVVTIGDWRLAISRDRFSGQTLCHLASRNGRLRYEQGAVGFQFNTRWDVAEAVYRLDGGPARPARDDLPELIRSGVPTDAGGMTNPSAGMVWIPIHRLAVANSVAIQPRPNSRPSSFHFRGLMGLRGLARDRGCSPESAFLP